MNPVDTAEVTWRSSAERVARARITDFTCWLKESKGLDCAEVNAAVRAAAAGARVGRSADRAHQVGHPRGLSVRYVLHDVIAVAEVPRTLTGKKLEVPLKKLLLGQLGRQGSPARRNGQPRQPELARGAGAPASPAGGSPLKENSR